MKAAVNGTLAPPPGEALPIRMVPEGATLAPPEPARYAPRFYRDYPAAAPQCVFHTKVRGATYGTYSVWHDGRLYLRLVGRFSRLLGGKDSLLKALRHSAAKIDYVANHYNDVKPEDRVYRGAFVPVDVVADMDAVAADPELVAALRRLRAAAENTRWDRENNARVTPSAAPATPPAPLPLDDLKAAVRARLAAKQADDGALARETESRHEAERRLTELTTAVLNAALLTTDAERLAALEVIADRLTS